MKGHPFTKITTGISTAIKGIERTMKNMDKIKFTPRFNTS
jgi:hypothetical protein